jgi:nicotinate phosphoribosyltransferase
VMGERFVGTSNTWMASRHDLSPIGTNAHELQMVTVALAPDHEKVGAQYETLKNWQQAYGQGLRVILPDTYGTEQFFKNAPSWISEWRGLRQDSGSPVSQGRLYIEWLKSQNKDPREKLLIPSDGLDVDTMLDIDRALGSEINISYGWGTLLTNDFRGCHSSSLLRPFSIVCKVVEANGKPCVKLSNNIEKATGERDEIERYINLFQYGPLMHSPVLV